MFSILKTTGQEIEGQNQECSHFEMFMFGNLHRNVHDPVVSHVQPLQVLDDGEDVDGELLQPQPREVEIAELVPHLLHRPQAEGLQADDLQISETEYFSSASKQKKIKMLEIKV